MFRRKCGTPAPGTLCVFGENAAILRECHLTSLKVCVMITTEMMTLLQGESTYSESVKGNWGIVKKNLCSIQTQMGLGGPLMNIC